MIEKTFKKLEKPIKRWYMMLLVGIVFVILGIWTIATPADSYVALSFIFALGFIISGISEIIFAFGNKHQYWGWSLALGIISTIVGVLLLLNPAASMITLPFYVGFTLLFRSISGMVSAYEMKQYGILDWGTLMVTAVLGMIFSFILIWNPVFAGINIVIWTAIVFLVLGGYTIYFSFKLKKLNKLKYEK